MDKNVALDVLKKGCGADEYKTYALAVATAIDGIRTALVSEILSSHPDLTAEIEANLERSDRAL